MKVARKYLVHYLDAAFDTTYTQTEYAMLGKDLEEFTVELNPDIEIKKNILGENSVKHNGYDASSSADPIYYDYDDKLSAKLMEIAMLRKEGDECKSSYVEVLLKPSELGGAPEVLRAIREDVYVVPQSYGGDTSGVQVPIEIKFAGNRVEGNFDLTTKKFTAEGL